MVFVMPMMEIKKAAVSRSTPASLTVLPLRDVQKRLVKGKTYGQTFIPPAGRGPILGRYPKSTEVPEL